jgi:hypothetical protein
MVDLQNTRIEDVADALKLHYTDREIDQLVELLGHETAKAEPVTDVGQKLFEEADQGIEV